MKFLKKAVDAAFLAWVFLVFFFLPTIVLDLYEPEWVEEKSSVKQIKLTYEFVDYEKQPRDFIKNYRTSKSEKQRANKYSSRGGRRVLTMTATAYCSCIKCCGKSDGITASGAKARWGTVAAPKWLPFGTRLKIEGFDTVFIVEDRGGAIVGNRLDIWFPTHEQAVRFGKKKVKVEVLND